MYKGIDTFLHEQPKKVPDRLFNPFFFSTSHLSKLLNPNFQFCGLTGRERQLLPFISTFSLPSSCHEGTLEDCSQFKSSSLLINHMQYNSLFYSSSSVFSRKQAFHSFGSNTSHNASHQRYGQKNTGRQCSSPNYFNPYHERFTVVN